MTIPTLTLAAIRAQSPCADGWRRLLAALGNPDDTETRVSLGDVALSNGAQDALWCIRALDWRDVAVRRAVIAGGVLPAVRRANAHTTDQRVHDCIAAVAHWCVGDDSVNLGDAALAARAAADAAWAAADAAAWAAAAADVAWDAAAADVTKVRAAQVADIIAAAPLHALARRD